MIPLVKVGMPDKADLMPALEDVLYGGQIGEGEAVYAFEAAFAATFELPIAIAMSSGTAALHAALHLAGVVDGDEVISTAMTAEPTNLAILHAGAQVVWADVNAASGNLDPAMVARRITAATKAIVVVHYAGYPVDMAGIMDVARMHGLPVIEDCAHALGARSAGRPIGTIGDFAIFSLQAIKHMTTVDGGILTFRDQGLADVARRFRWFGLTKGKPRTELDLATVGWKYNMNNVTATIGLQQLAVIGSKIDRHKENGRWFDSVFSAENHVRPARVIAGDEASYWLYTLMCDDSDAIEQALAKCGIAASKLHRRNDAHTIFATSATPLPGLDDFARHYLHLPCGWWVTDEDRLAIVDAVRDCAA